MKRYWDGSKDAWRDSKLAQVVTGFSLQHPQQAFRSLDALRTFAE